MLLTRNYCRKTFEAKKPKRCCSPECAMKRQLEAIKQMRSKKGEMFDRWTKNIDPFSGRGRRKKSKTKAR